MLEAITDPAEAQAWTVEDCKARALLLAMSTRDGLPAISYWLAAAGLEDEAGQVMQLQVNLLRVLRVSRRRRSRSKGAK